MKLNIKNRGVASLAITLIGSIIGLGLLGAAILKNNGSLSSLNKESFLALMPVGAGGEKDVQTSIPTIQVLSPNGGETYSPNTPIPITWTMDYDSGDTSVVVYLYSPTLGNVYQSGPLIGMIGSNQWNIPLNAAPSAGQYKITVCDNSKDMPDMPGKALCDTSDNIFMIGVPVVAPTISIYPNSGPIGTVITINSTVFDSTNVVSFEWTGKAIYGIKQFNLPSDGKPVSFAVPNFITDPDIGDQFDVTPAIYQILLSNKNGKSNLVYFTVTAPTIPTITGFSPTSGPVGTRVKVYGTNLNKITEIMLTERLCCKYYKGASRGVEWSPTSDTEIEIPLPSSFTPGNYLIDVYSPSGSSSSSAENSPVFTITAPKSTCAPSTTCNWGYCQYGGNLKNCITTNTDCNTSLLTTGSCNSAPTLLAPTPIPTPAPAPVSSSCDETAKTILDAVGGCGKLDSSAYSNIYNVCCKTTITKEGLLKILNDALIDGVIDKEDKLALLSALNSYLSNR